MSDKKKMVTFLQDGTRVETTVEAAPDLEVRGFVMEDRGDSTPLPLAKGTIRLYRGAPPALDEPTDPDRLVAMYNLDVEVPDEDVDPKAKA